MNNPLGVSPSKGNQGTTRGKEKILLTSVGIEPTTSGLDLPLLCWLSYEVGHRKSGTIWVVNRGEEKVRVHMNVVPSSTMNTNGETEDRRGVYLVLSSSKTWPCWVHSFVFIMTVVEPLSAFLITMSEFDLMSLIALRSSKGKLFCGLNSSVSASWPLTSSK